MKHEIPEHKQNIHNHLSDGDKLHLDMELYEQKHIFHTHEFGFENSQNNIIDTQHFTAEHRAIFRYQDK